MTTTIRTLHVSDAEALLAFERHNRTWFERHVAPRGDDFYTRNGVHDHIAHYLAAHARGTWHPCVILDADGVLIGRANLKDIDRTKQHAEVGGRIAQEHAGKGLATAALRHLATLARDEWRLTQLLAYVADANLASARVLERCGFVRGAGATEVDTIGGVAVAGHAFSFDLNDGAMTSLYDRQKSP